MNDALKTAAALANRPETWDFSGAGTLYAGVDVGTFKIGVIVVDEKGRPRAGLIRRADVVKSGLIVDYMGALNHVREMIGEIRARSPLPIEKGATSYPPQTEAGNIQTTRYILEAVGLEVVSVLDEPSAANAVLCLASGAIVDVGGGTTGVAVIRDGRIVFSDDQATGGVHLTLVLAGGLGVSYDEAERIKVNKSRQGDLLPMVRPVLEKISTIVLDMLAGNAGVDRLCLVGGATEFEGFAQVVSSKCGIEAFRPDSPQIVTPLGIALSCLNSVGGGR